MDRTLVAWLARALLIGTCLLMVFVTAGFASSANADPKTIDISSGFPSDDLPLGTSFFLTTKPADGATNVYAIFVEYADGAFGSKAESEFDSCGEVQRTVHLDPLLLRAAMPGELKFSAIALDPNKDPKLKDDKTGKAKLVTAFLRRPALLLAGPPRDDKGALSRDANKLVKLAVPSTKFFKHGAHYCLLTSEDRSSSMVDRTVQDRLQSIAACALAPTGCDQGMLDKSEASLDKTQRETLTAALGPAVALVSAAHPTNHADPFSTDLDDLHLRLPKRESPDGIPWLDVSHGVPTCDTPSQNDPLGDVLLLLLIRKGELVRSANGDVVLAKDPTKRLTKVRIDTAPSLGGLFETLNDPKKAKATAKPPASAPEQIQFAAQTKDLGIPASGWVVDDLLHLSAGEVATPDEVVNVKAVGVAINSMSLATLLTADPDKTLQSRLVKLSQRADTLSTVLEVAEAAAQKTCTQTTDAQPDALTRALGRWSSVGGSNTSTSPKTPPVALSALLGAIAAQSANVGDALSKWDPSKAVIARQIVTLVAGPAIDVSIGLNPQTWVFSYLTPTVGYVTTSDSFGVPTINLELTFFANSTDEPMWTNGNKDFRRLMSIELGVAPQAGNFGPNQRYSGPGPLPPLLVGLGAQLIPYTVISWGAMFVDGKTSALTDETAKLKVVGYVGASVQANIPDLVLNLVNGKKTSGE